jgi:hypothetical protein
MTLRPIVLSPRGLKKGQGGFHHQGSPLVGDQMASPVTSNGRERLDEPLLLQQLHAHGVEVGVLHVLQVLGHLRP